MFVLLRLLTWCTLGFVSYFLKGAETLLKKEFVTALTYLPYLGVSAEAHNQRNIYLHCGGGSLQKKRNLEVPPPQEWIDNDPLFTCLVLESSRDSNRRHSMILRTINWQQATIACPKIDSFSKN